MKTRRPHVAIMVAAAKGRGLRLSAEEVRRLSFDDAIATAATEMLVGPEKIERGWERIKP